MKTNLKKYGLPIIAAVLLVAMTCAGAAGAYDAEYTSDAWNALSAAPTSGEYHIIDGTEPIYPRNLTEETRLVLTGNLTLDFTGYTSGFSGIETEELYAGALFSVVDTDGDEHTLEIIGLNMTAVSIVSVADPDTEDENLGCGLIGCFKADACTLNITDCHLDNCTIAAYGIYSGGLVGKYTGGNLNIRNCDLTHGDVVAEYHGDCGGLVGLIESDYPARITNCRVINSTLAGGTKLLQGANIGGLIGTVDGDNGISIINCSVENSSVYGYGAYVGGIVGHVGYYNGLPSGNFLDMQSCNVTNCVVAGNYEKVGGLVGGVNNVSASNNTVKGCAITGSSTSSTGGLIGSSVGTSTLTWSGSDNDILDTVVAGNLIGPSSITAGFCRNTAGSQGSATVYYYQSQYPSNDTGLTTDADKFWQLIKWGGNATTAFTILGVYGEAEGYGACLPDYTVSFQVVGDGDLQDEDGTPLSRITGVPPRTTFRVGSDGDSLEFSNDYFGYETSVYPVTGSGSHFVCWEPASGRIADDMTVTAVFEENTMIYPGEYTAASWNEAMSSASIPELGPGTYTFTGTGIIKPKNTLYAAASGSIVLDFSGYRGSFAGHSDDGYAGPVGALFGSIDLSRYNNALEIIGLNLAFVNVTSGNDCIGGIIGNVDNGSLTFTDCRLVDCSITGTTAVDEQSGSRYVGGLVGYAGNSALVLDSCSALHCDIISLSQYVGGLAGYAKAVNADTCLIENCTVAAPASNKTGGIIGYVGTSPSDSAIFTGCNVRNTSVYTDSGSVGGLAGNTGSGSIMFADCNVTNCVLVCADKSGMLGGLAGRVQPDNDGDISDCTIANCTLYSKSKNKGSCIGGLIGYGNVSASSQPHNNKVVYSAIRGNVYGGMTDNESVGGSDCTGSVSGKDLDVRFYATADTSSPITPQSQTFWKNVYWGGVSTTPYTILGEYGTADGYGVIPHYTVTVASDIQHGTVTVSSLTEGTSIAATAGSDIAVAAVPESGYATHNLHYVPDGTTQEVPITGTAFTMPASDVLVNATFEIIRTNVTASGNVAEFHNDNTTVVQSATETVSSVLLENVSNVADTYVNFTAGVSVAEIPDITGYTKEQITVFEINATLAPGATSAQFNVTVTFADRPTATADKGKIRFWHYNTTNDAWDTPALTIVDMVQTGEKVLYTVETTSFSPFGFGIYTEIPTPKPTHGSSSKDMGSTVILTEPVTPTPTATPGATAVPTIATVNPTSQQTSKSPVPFVGLIAGLGAAAVLLRLRK